MESQRLDDLFTDMIIEIVTDNKAGNKSF